MSRDAREIDRRSLLLAPAGAAALSLPTGAGATPSTDEDGGFARAQPFDLGWRFHRGAGEGFEAPGLDDAGWRTVDLPHDWSIEDLPPDPTPPHLIVGPFDKAAVGGTATGFTVGGEGWYRKRFRLAAAKPGRVEVVFDGVYMDSEVWLNGHSLGVHPNGYTPFAYDLTPYLVPGGENVLAVRVRNLGRNSRWYAGSGIYRHVWLDVLATPARIARWGVGVVTRRLHGAGAELALETRLEDIAPGLTLVSRVRDADGRTVRAVSAPAAPLVRQRLTLANPRLWSPDSPALYTLETELRHGATLLDRQITEFGVRVVAFDAEHGMTLNGVPTKLRGGCVHHDNGLLGACAFDGAEDRKVRLLKERGYNALRPSHNLFSPAFLRACDRHGVLVVEETFDAWREAKLPQDYSVDFDAQWRSDLAAIILSTRNHPSVILWSIGNEIPGRNSPDGIELQWRLADAAHRLDPTRPVTAAINSFPGRLVKPSPETARHGSGAQADYASNVFLDMVGYNYKLADYEADHQRFPNRVFFGTESFPKDIFRIWDLTDRNPWLAGDFVWTAMDYLGEAGVGGTVSLPATSHAAMASLGAWPWVNAYCGDLDITGRRKGASLARDVVWGLSPLEVAVQRPQEPGKVEVVRLWGWSDEWPSWTWPGAEGRPLAVRVYTAGDRVELRLNGAPVAQRDLAAADLKHVEFQVPYAPGVLEAVAYRGGVELARRRLETGGPATTVRLTPEQATGGAGRGDVSYVAVELVDAKGRIDPTGAPTVRLSINGPAELVGFGTGEPFAIEGFQSATAKTWNGEATAILRGRGQPGEVRIDATADGLATGTTSLILA